MSISTSVPTEQIASTGKVWQTGLIAAGLSAVANLIIWFVAGALGVSFNLAMTGAEAAPPFAFLVVVATVFGVLAGTLIFWLMPRISKRPVTHFRTLAIVVLILSFAQPLLLLTSFMPMSSPVAVSTVIALEIMHVVAGVITIWLLTTRARA